MFYEVIKIAHPTVVSFVTNLCKAYYNSLYWPFNFSMEGNRFTHKICTFAFISTNYLLNVKLMPKVNDFIDIKNHIVVREIKLELNRSNHVSRKREDKYLRDFRCRLVVLCYAGYSFETEECYRKYMSCKLKLWRLFFWEFNGF